MKKINSFFRTWIDWWLFIPLSFFLAISSYWFVPEILTRLGIAEQDMTYTGTAWVYSLFHVLLVFMLGLGACFVVYRFFFPQWHEYLESTLFYNDSENIAPSKKVIISLMIPAVLFIGFCILCTAIF